MNASVTSFPFWKLRYDKYMTLDVLMYIDYREALQFMFAVSKQARLFLHSNIVPFINEFENEGLITYEIDNRYEGFKLLERLYFSLLKRTIPNRILTIRVSISLKNNYLALK